MSQQGTTHPSPLIIESMATAMWENVTGPLFENGLRPKGSTWDCVRCQPRSKLTATNISILFTSILWKQKGAGKTFESGGEANSHLGFEYSLQLQPIAKTCVWQNPSNSCKRANWIMCSTHPTLPTFSTGRRCHSPSVVSLKRNGLSCCCIKIMWKYKRSSYGNYRLTHRWLQTHSQESVLQWDLDFSKPLDRYIMRL